MRIFRKDYKADVDKYGKQAMEKTILDAISVTDVGPEAE